MSSITNHILYKENPLTNWLIAKISKINISILFLCTLIFVIIGWLINCISSFPSFIFFQILFAIIFISSVFAIKYYEKTMETIHQKSSGDIKLQPIKDKNHRIRRNILNIICPVLGMIYFGIFASILINNYIFSPACIYLIIEYSISVPISLIGYMQYIYLWIFLKNVKNVDHIRKYDADYPSNTDWLVDLAKLYTVYRNGFFSLGVFYILGVIYFVFIEDFSILTKAWNYSVYFISLILFWGGVFLAIVVIFPISSAMMYQYITSITEKLKKQSVSYIIKNFPANAQFELKIQKTAVVIDIFNTPRYPIRDFAGILFSSALSIFNVAASIVAVLQFIQNSFR